MSEAWTFDEWFKAQHGPRPTNLATELLRDKIKTARLILQHDEELLRRLDEWESKQTAASYAWNVRPEQKRTPLKRGGQDERNER